ncbi:MAG: F420-nonreducing hydrogenase [Myxococcota bacterium]
MSQVTLTTGHLQGCFGCHVALLDLHEELLPLFARVQLLRSPLNDVKEVPEADIGILDGCIANEDNLRLAEKFRQRSNKLVALGTCSTMGGIPGLRNLHSASAVLQHAYLDLPSNTEATLPTGPNLPPLLPDVRAVGQVVKVDYEIPGCPPLPSVIASVLTAILDGREPELPQRNLCYECVRRHEKLLVPTREFVTSDVHAIMELEHIDPQLCFLEQGLLCMGPATRQGCDSRCVRASSPCRGCMGPTAGAREQGAKMVNALASVLPAGGLMALEDVVGVGYRYALPVSIVPRRQDRAGEKKR